MYRISHTDGHTMAKGVCHDCKAEAPARIWAEAGDGYQTVPPSGWTPFLDGRMQRLRCAPCQTDRDDRCKHGVLRHCGCEWCAAEFPSKGEQS